MSALFPPPVHSYTTFSDVASTAGRESTSPSVPTPSIPNYPLRVKHHFVPRRQDDFGDGGAYPELHVAQFPLGMGKKGENGSVAINSGTLALQVRGENGHVRYDAIVTQHHRDKHVYTQFSDIVEKDADAATLALPTHDEEIETATRTREALQAVVQGKVASSLPTHVGRQRSAKETAQYIRYTPHDQATTGDVPKQRIIRMVEVAKDPMEPPKFRHTKAVRGPPSPPVPVLHSPPRKLTVADQQSWKIPPCISNWKNSKGFTIALDKRLAADGRGLQQVTVNDNFASLSEALAIAERKAREEVNMRAQVQKKMAMKQKEQKENELRELASRARMERAGIRADSEENDGPRRRRRSSSAESPHRRHEQDEAHDASDTEGRQERDQIRWERKKEREREMRLEKLGKKGKLARDQDRDISEKIALGQLQGAGRASGSDGMFDSRLFNQSQGISSGFGHEDEYNVYSKPMVDRGKASVYRPKAEDGTFDAEKEYEALKGGHAKRFKADKQFQGTDAVAAQSGGRDGPVQFAYAQDKPHEQDATQHTTREQDAQRDETRRSTSASPSKTINKLRSPSSSPRQARARRQNSSSPRRRGQSVERRASVQSRGRRRSVSESPRRSRGSKRSGSRSPMRSERPRRSVSGSPMRSNRRRRSVSSSPPRSRGRGRSKSSSPPRPRRRGRVLPSPSRSRARSASRGRKRLPSRSRSCSRKRGRPRPRSRSRSSSRGQRRRGRSPPARRARSRTRSRSRGNARSKRRHASSSDESDDDPFGLDQFLTDARKSGNVRRAS